MSEIKIVDVIVTNNPFSKDNHYSVVVDRMPARVYARNEQYLMAHDSGFYDFLRIVPGSTGAFGGRSFTIGMTGGAQLECHGQVWDCAAPDDCEPVVSVGVATIAELERIYVFGSASLSKARLDAWLAENTPSRDYYKYDPKETYEWARQRVIEHGCGLKMVSRERARTLKARGVDIFSIDGAKAWSPWLEQRKAAIALRVKEYGQ